MTSKAKISLQQADDIYAKLSDSGKRYLTQANELCIGPRTLDTAEHEDLVVIIGSMSNQLVAQSQYIEGQQGQMLELARHNEILKQEIERMAKLKHVVIKEGDNVLRLHPHNIPPQESQS